MCSVIWTRKCKQEKIYVGESGNFEENIKIYNNVIKLLNEEAEKYRKKNDEIVIEARSVGSMPDKPNYDEVQFFYGKYEWFTSYNGVFKNQDRNYEYDFNQMKNLNISMDEYHNQYYLASRLIESDYSNVYKFMIYNVDFDGGIFSDVGLCTFAGGDISANNYYRGVRPVFRLIQGVKIESGDGTPDNPYTLAP